MTDPSHSLTLLISRVKKDMVPKSPQMSLNSSFILHKYSGNPVLHSSTFRPRLTPPPSAPDKRGKVIKRGELKKGNVNTLIITTTNSRSGKWDLDPLIIIGL